MELGFVACEDRKIFVINFVDFKIDNTLEGHEDSV